MELRHLRYFIAVAEERNFSRAAQKLNIAQPPLSQQIKALEDELKVQLIDRTKRPLQLTLAGQTFLESVRTLIVQLEQAKKLTQRVHRGEWGRLSIGFTSSVANSVLPDIQRAFTQRFEQVKLVWREMTTDLQIQGLRDRMIDVAFFHPSSGSINDNNLNVLTLFEEPLIIILPENHPLNSLPEIPLQALAQEEFVLPSSQLVSGLSEQIYLLCHQAGFVPKVTQEATLMLTILGLVAGEVGVALLPENARNLQRKGVIYKTIQGQTATVEMSVVWRSDDSSPILNNFLEVTKALSFSG